MSNILETSKEIKKKLSFDDYTTQPTEWQAGTPVNQQTVMPVQQQAKSQDKSNKIKATYYLSEKDNKALTALYIKRLQNNIKTDKSALICEAIQLLYKKEHNQD